MNLFENCIKTSKLILKGLEVMNVGFDNDGIAHLLRITLTASLTHAFQEIFHVGRNFNTVSNENIVDMLVEAKCCMTLLSRALFNAKSLSH